MKINYENLYKINHWFHLIETVNGKVCDVLYLNMQGDQPYIQLNFSRNKAFLYNVEMRDYVFNYSPDYAFLTFYEMLKKTRKNKQLNIIDLKNKFSGKGKPKFNIQRI